MTRRTLARPQPSRFPAPDDYLRLVAELPVRPIRTRAEYVAAQEVLDDLIGRDDLSPGEQDYAAALARFVEEFEREQEADRRSRQTPLELLRHLLQENGMSTTDLGDVLGSRGLASEVLNGKRGLSKALIRKLAAHFGLPAGLFLEAMNAERTTDEQEGRRGKK